ncbi:MAG: BamA/TamA family outer membrane protein [Bacteriovorax sp.]|nr:BamA/TamA family outer membrane protein [Bacteriovorax sp.]
MFLSSCGTTPTDVRLCEKITLHSPEKIEFTDTEKQLVCGDPEVEAYKVIPAYQAKYLFDGFLQSRGFSHPKYVFEKDLMHVYTEDKSYLTTVVANSAEDEISKLIEKEIIRYFKKEVITPKLLDAIEARAKTILRNHSYPCAKVASTTEPLLGKVILNLTGLKTFKFGPVILESIEGVADRALARFFSFKPEYLFGELELNLTEKRYLRQGIVQATFFQESCDLQSEQFSLTQKFIIGPPRTIRFGVGASTELGPMARAKWTNQRYGAMASILEASAQASFKNQSLKFRADNYIWATHPRQSLVSELILERNNQSTFTETSAQLRPHLQWTDDTPSRFWLWSLGPALLAGSYKTEIKSENRNFKTGAIEGFVQTKTHTFEFFDIHPEEGDFSQINFDYRHPSFGFDNPLLKLDLSFLKLFWLANLGKGSVIAGLRLNPSTTWVPNNISKINLPPSVKYYGGGSDDLRGFKLSTLPDNTGLGALTKLGAKLEFRKTYFFVPSLESVAFVDTALFGERPWSVESRLWYSPGVGLRWLSPIGLVQTYLARSLSTQSSTTFARDNGFLLFLGLGGVF